MTHKIINCLLAIMICGGTVVTDSSVVLAYEKNDVQETEKIYTNLLEHEEISLKLEEIPVADEVDEKEEEEVKSINQYDLIASAALSQIGVNQDCTMLVTNSLASVGINFHGAPEQYSCLGEWTNNPVPGDVIIYSGHVAIYIGNGQAVHGGWNGYTTVVFSVECSNQLIGYIHVNL